MTNKKTTTNKKKKTGTSSLTYPTGLTSGDTDFLHIAVLKYVPPGITSNANGFAFQTSDQKNRVANGGKDTRIIGNIFLPVPTNVTDRNSVSWRESRLNSLALDAIQESKGVIGDLSLDTSLQQSVDALKARFSSVAGKYKEAIESEAVRDSLETFFISKAVNVVGANVDAQDLISRSQGAVLNPNLELLFKSVNLRQFNYTFILTPRTRQEAQTVKGIIKTFKKRMAAKSTADSVDGGSGLFIGAPDVFQLTFKRGTQDHPFLHDHKICALTDMQVNYTGTGAYATYDDATPVQTNITLTFSELSPVYAEEYDLNDTDAGVGF